MLTDLRFALRSLLRSPSFTLAAVIALGLGTGAAAGVFSLLEGVVLRPLPYRQPDRLVMLWDRNGEKALEHQQLSPVNFLDYRALGGTFEDAAAWWRPEINLTDETGEAIRVSSVETSENLFAVLGVRPVLGRTFVVDSTLHGAEPEAVISHRLWQSRFGGDPSIVGRLVRLNGFGYTVVGVMPPGFGFPGETDLWQRLGWNLAQHSRAAHFMEAVGRLRPGVTVEQANRDMAALGTRLATDFRATNTGWSTGAVALDHEIAGVFRSGLFALLGASGLLLLIACINVANLLLARATSRQREVAVRAAMGASRQRLVRLFLTESVVLAVAGAILGLAVAVASVKGLLAWTPIRIPRADAIAVNAPVLVFATLVAAATVLAFGLVPALLMSRADLQDALKEGAKGSGSRGRGMRSTLVVAEVALAVVLLSGAGLLVRSVGHLLRESTGVDPTSVITADIQLPNAGYREWPRVDLFYSRLTQALRERPEVAAAGAGNFLPLEVGWRFPLRVAGAAPPPPGENPTAQYHSVDEGYFSALRIPLVRGRTFAATDLAASTPVVVVNETLARELWPGEDAVGKRLAVTARGVGPLGFRLTEAPEHEIVGVVRDLKNTSRNPAADPAIYFAERQFPFRRMHLVVRGRGDAARLAALVREEVRRIDAAIPLGDVKSMDRVLAESVDPPRFVMLLMGVFAGLALTLAAVGIYGILTYAVTHRRREIGIRLALGAQPGTVLRMIVREGLVLAVTGCLIGVGGAYLAGKSLGGFLYGVTPWDPPTLAGVVAIVIAIAAAACLVPGRRASREDPAGALRTD
jgi:putative ABC transport system permease protein